ncbi:ATP-binding protein [Streptosporangium sp. NPDC006007]|uniref:ATP-binding protein n=1 Tax=Streptosporangium sp. NPDC006007 TaxID=3154575 RepID=UPI0033B9F4AB
MIPGTLHETCLPRIPESVSRARDKVRTWLGRDDPAYENARLAVSELVTNAVQHGGGQYAGNQHGEGRQGGKEPDERSWADSLLLRLTVYDDLLCITVTDRGWSQDNPRIRVEPVCRLVESGRGLAIVNALSGGNWGYRSHGPGLGRTVWCEIPANPPPCEDPLPDTSTLLVWSG